MHAVEELHPRDRERHSQARRIWPRQPHDDGESGERADDVTEHDGTRRAGGGARQAEEEDGHRAEWWAEALEVARLSHETGKMQMSAERLKSATRGTGWE